MERDTSKAWRERHRELLERARQMKAQPVVERHELVELQMEIRELERRIDRPLPVGVKALRPLRSADDDRPGRAPTQVEEKQTRRRCPFGSCDGSGWHLHEVEDVASPCKCQRLPRDTSSRRQTSRILRRHLALSLDVPPLVELEPQCIDALRGYTADLSESVRAGQGLWFAGPGDSAEVACAYLAGEALRREVPVLLYPGDELIGRLRRLAAPDLEGINGVEEEIYEKLATVDLLIVDGLDAATAPERYPEPLTPELSPGNSPCSSKESAENVEGDRERALTGKAAPYEPGMTGTDLSRLFEVFDQRLMNERATVITTQNDIPILEERVLRVPGGWPLRDVTGEGLQIQSWDEAQRRASNLRRLISRLTFLCGAPLVAQPRNISVYRNASDRRSMLAG